MVCYFTQIPCVYSGMNPRRVIKKQKEAWSKKAKAGVKTKGREKKQPAWLAPLPA